MKKVLAIVLTLCMLISVVPMAFSVSAETATSTVVFDNGDMENAALDFAGDDAAGKATSSLSSAVKKNGNYSNKLEFAADASKHATFWLESNANYDLVPIDEYINITFWAKADDVTGFRGAVLVNDTAQFDSNKGNKARLDHEYGGKFGIGTGLGSDGWAEVSKVWTKYVVPVHSKTLADSEIDYEILVSLICIAGQGTIYIDDISVESQHPSLIDNGDFELGDAFIKYGGGASLGRTGEEKRSGNYSAKYVDAGNQNADAFIISEAKYYSIPRGKKVMLTFWAKADENVGFTGMVGTPDVAQGVRNSWWGDRYKLDGYRWLYAFGGLDGTDPNTSNYETLPTEWTKYYIPLPEVLIDTNKYSCLFSDLRIRGTGTLYIDDIDIELVDEVLDNGTVDNGGAEKDNYSIEYPENVSANRVSNEKHSGKYSTKFTSNGNALAKFDMRINSTGDHYAKIPLNEQIYITFWAKADDEIGFSGFIGSGNIYQLPSENDSGKRDGYMMTTAFGSSDMTEAGFVEISKEWTKYFIKVNNFFTDGFESAYAYLKLNGYGAVYIDDIAFEAVDADLIDNTGYGTNMNLGKVNLSVKTVNFGNTYTSDLFASDDFTQSIKISNTTADEAIGNLKVEVNNADYETVYTEIFSVDVAAREYDIFTLTIPGLTKYGKYTIDYTYTDANGEEYAQTEFTNVKKSENNSGIYNICLDLGSETDAKYDSIFEALSNSGVEYFRIDMRWDNIETTAGVYNFPEYYSRMFASAQKFGMKPLVVVAYKNALYGDVDSNDFFANSNAVAAYAAYAAKIVETYADYIDAVEIYNEPNHLNISAAQYANMLKASYTAIKNVKDTVKVVGGVTSLADSDYIGSIIDNGAGDYMDIISVHPYVYNNLVNSKPERIVDDIAAVKNVLTAKNCNKPIWVTELNWPTNDTWHGSTEEEQAEYLTRAMLALQGEDSVEKLFVYTAIDNETGSDDTEMVFGIFKSADYTTANAAKLSYAALSQFANITYGKDASAVNLGSGIKAYEYTNGKNTVTAIWSPSGEKTVSWNAEDSVKIYDMYGNLMYVNDAQITVGTAPVYVVNYVKGDVNEDNDVNIRDLVRIKKNFVELIYSDVMDVNADYTVDSVDIAEIRIKLLNK